jgi:hypothetical protein
VSVIVRSHSGRSIFNREVPMCKYCSHASWGWEMLYLTLSHPTANYSWARTLPTCTNTGRTHTENLKISPLPLLYNDLRSYCHLVNFLGTIQVMKPVHFHQRVRQWGAEIIWVTKLLAIQTGLDGWAVRVADYGTGDPWSIPGAGQIFFFFSFFGYPWRSGLGG